MITIIKKRLLTLFVVFHHAIALDLPPEFKRCKAVELKECLIVAVQENLRRLENGLPELNLQPLQPLHIPSITVGEGKGAVNVVQNFKNVNIYNIPHAIINKAELDSSGTTFAITIEAFVKEIIFEAEYSVNGKVLLLPIQGSGNAVIKFSDANATVKFHGGAIKRKGVMYRDVKKTTFQLVPKKIEFRFDNLFEGDERLTNEINQVLNNNWKEIWADIKESYEEVLALVIQDITNRILRNVPHKRLIL